MRKIDEAVEGTTAISSQIGAGLEMTWGPNDARIGLELEFLYTVAPMGYNWWGKLQSRREQPVSTRPWLSTRLVVGR